MTELPKPHALCMPCWAAIAPGALPARPAEADRELERCCRCGSLTVAGIYTSSAAGFFACPGPAHPQPEVDPAGPEGAWAWTRDQIAEAELRDRLVDELESITLHELPQPPWRPGDRLIFPRLGIPMRSKPAPPPGWVWSTPDPADLELLRVDLDAPPLCPFCASASCPAALSGDEKHCGPWQEAEARVARGEWLPTLPGLLLELGGGVAARPARIRSRGRLTAGGWIRALRRIFR